MPNLNRVFLAGNLTRDVELKTTGGNSTVGSFGLAVNRTWNNAAGEKQEEVTFIDCTAWGKTAEVMAKYLSKGRPVLLEGRLKLDQWEDKKDGSKRSKLSVVVESFQFLDSKGSEDKPEPAPARQASTPAARGYAGHEPIDDKSLPF